MFKLFKKTEQTEELETEETLKLSDDEICDKGSDFYAEEKFGEALKFFRIGANRGHAASQIKLAFLYRMGDGVTPNADMAVKYAKLAVDQGDAVGQFTLGHWYIEGFGVPQDLKKGFKLCKLAADQGFVRAYISVGIAYKNGLGVKESRFDAKQWFLKAVESKNPEYVGEGAYQLGDFYHDTNKAEAKMWYEYALKEGYNKAQKRLREL